MEVPNEILNGITITIVGGLILAFIVFIPKKVWTDISSRKSLNYRIKNEYIKLFELFLINQQDFNDKIEKMDAGDFKKFLRVFDDYLIDVTTLASYGVRINPGTIGEKQTVENIINKLKQGYFDNKMESINA